MSVTAITTSTARGPSAGPEPGFAPRAAEGDTAPTPFDDHLASRLLLQRIIVLGTQVDEVSANRVCAQLLLLSAEEPKSDISLYINSPGGSVTAGLAIYDTMRLIPNDVSTLAMGFAGSMGQFLLTVGTAGKRYALPNARIMMHQPSAGIGGTAADIAIQAENLEFTKKAVERITAEHTGHSEETISRDSDRDRWFTAAQAREYGMVDHVVTSFDDVRPVSGTRRRAGL
ncbi:ClpP family protease [Streptomyces sp. NPDC004609]|uniref:ClpP family protease n=1 Tax=Streptomyces sp. NPDC004609 TaxID=3364704 RepID=UPI0036A7ED9F